MMQKTGSLIANNRKFLPLLATVALFFIAYAAGASFFEGMRDPQVFFNLFRDSPFLLISAVGMTLVIISGGIDLSVSGMVALTTVASAALLREGWNPWVVILLMLAMGMAFGAVMGSFITFLKVQPFIATLAGMWLARGLCFFISDDAIKISSRVYQVLGQTKILIPGLADPVTKKGDYISILVVIMLLVLAAGIYIAHFTRFGRTIYAMGGNEASARLMGLPVNSTKVLVYTLNGFCSALAGIMLSIYVMSGHGLYAPGFEMTVIAAVVIGGTMLTGGTGYVFGTLFGVLITGLIQTLIQFNGKLSSWWTTIVVGLLTLVFIGVQSLLAAQKTRQVASQRLMSQAKIAGAGSGLAGVRRGRAAAARSRQILFYGAGAVLVIALAVAAIILARGAALGGVGNAPTQASAACTLKPFRHDQVEALIQDGAVIAYERNGGSNCVDELYGIYADGRVVGDDGVKKVEKQATPAEVEILLAEIQNRGWFSEEMYSTSHTPCGQCYSYYLSVSTRGKAKTVEAVDGGTDAPASYWQVVSLMNGFIPKFSSASD